MLEGQSSALQTRESM